MDFIIGAPLGKLVRFSLPLIGIMVLEGQYNTADSIIAG